MLDELTCMAIAEKVVDSLDDIEAEAAAVSRGVERYERDYKIEAVARTIFESQKASVGRLEKAKALARLAG